MDTLTKPLVLPEIKTTVTAYDIFKKRREALANAFESDKFRQILGSVADKRDGYCFIGLAEHVAKGL